MEKIIQSFDDLTPSQTSMPINALLDTRILQDELGRLLILSNPTADYDHGIVGDEFESSSITLINLQHNGSFVEISIPEGFVIEGLYPIWTDINGNGQREIIVTLSIPGQGAQLVIFNESGEIIGSGEPIGLSYRWRHQIAVAPFGPNGEIELVDVLTPHIGGVVEFFQLRNGEFLF